MTASEVPAAASAEPTTDENEPAGLRRDTATITIWNLVSRLTGFARVLATASALGIGLLGDTYQRTNQVSNVLFELLAGGMLFSVLVPSFVDDLRVGARDRAQDLAGALMARAVVFLGLLVVVGMLLAEPISALLAAGTEEATRDAQVELGAVLLLFVLPQLVVYAVGSVANGLLQADHRFAASSAAPVLNNLVVIASMVAFRAVHDPARGLDLTTGEQVLLGGGTLLGTVAMTIVPLVALRRAGLPIRPRWRVDHAGLGPLARRGLWGAGHVGLNQVLILATVVLAGAVPGGAIAYQTAFTFFLLPHALLAHPIFTARYPRLARDGAAGRLDPFASELGQGLRSIVFLLLPASAFLAVTAPPALSLLDYGQLDAAGTRMVAFGPGGVPGRPHRVLDVLPVDSGFLRAGRCPDADDRQPRHHRGDGGRPGWSVAGASTCTAVLVGFGAVTSVVASIGSVALFVILRSRIGRPIEVGATVARGSIAAGLRRSPGSGRGRDRLGRHVAGRAGHRRRGPGGPGG